MRCNMKKKAARRIKHAGWEKRELREKVTIKRIVESNYEFDRGTNLPKVRIITHEMKRNFGEDLPGVTALEEALAFLNAKKKFESPIWYKLALEASLKVVKGIKYYMMDGTSCIIEDAKDVEQVILEVLRSAGITQSVFQFMMGSIRKIA